MARRQKLLNELAASASASAKQPKSQIAVAPRGMGALVRIQTGRLSNQSGGKG